MAPTTTPFVKVRGAGGLAVVAVAVAAAVMAAAAVRVVERKRRRDGASGQCGFVVSYAVE